MFMAISSWTATVRVHPVHLASAAGVWTKPVSLSHRSAKLAATLITTITQPKS